MKHELKCLGPSLDHYDFNAWQYGDYFITLHAAVNETYIRLIQNRDNPAFYKVHANWCVGNESPKTGLFVLLGFCQFIDAVDRGYVHKLPYNSYNTPVWRDQVFKDWLLKHCFAISKEDGERIHREIRQSDTHALVNLVAADMNLKTDSIPWDRIEGT